MSSEPLRYNLGVSNFTVTFQCFKACRGNCLFLHERVKVREDAGSSPSKELEGEGAEELAAPLSKTSEPLRPRGPARDTGLGAGLARALAKATGGSCFLLQ